MIDLIFILLIAIGVFLTPKESRTINYLILSKFLITIGILEVILWAGMVDGAYIDIYRIGVNLLFMTLFYLVGATFLFSLCLMLAILHLNFMFFPSDSYFTVMVTMQALQLAACWGGMIDARLYPCGSRNYTANSAFASDKKGQECR